MTKIVLDTVSSGYNLGKINANFEKIEDQLNDKVLYRDQTATPNEPNELEQDLDLNSNRIINLPVPTSPTEPLRYGDITSDETGATVQYVDDSIVVAVDEATNTTVPQNIINDLSQDYGFDTVQLMKDSSIVFPLGKILNTKGYTTVDDFGGGKYRVVPNSSGVDDGGAYHDLSTGLQSKLLIDKVVNPKQWGAFSDGTNGTATSAACQAAAIYAIVNGLSYYIGAGFYNFASSVEFNFNLGKVIKIFGDGAGAENGFGNTIISYSGGSGACFNIGAITGGQFNSGMLIQDILFTTTNTTGITHGISLLKIFKNYINRCTFNNFSFAGSSGLLFKVDPTNALIQPVITRVTNCNFKNCYDGSYAEGLANIVYVFDSCIFVDMQRNGIRFDVNGANQLEMKNLIITKCEFEGFLNNAIYSATGLLGATIQFCYFEWVSTVSPIVIQSVTGNQNADISVRNNFFQGSFPVGEGLVNGKNINGITFKSNFHANFPGAAYFAVHDLGSSYFDGLDIESPQTIFAQPRLSPTDGITYHCHKSDEAMQVFNPTLAFGGLSTGITYTTNTSRYKRVGDMIFVWIYIVLSNKGTATGTASIEGLPVLASGNSDNRASGNILTRATNFVGLTGAPFSRLVQGTTGAPVYQHGATGESILTDANFGNGTSLALMMTYRAIA